MWTLCRLMSNESNNVDRLMNDKKTSLFKEYYNYKETKGKIITDDQKNIRIAKNTIKKNRKQLDEYVKKNSLFVNSFKPIKVNKGPILVKRMAELAERQRKEEKT